MKKHIFLLLCNVLPDSMHTFKARGRTLGEGCDYIPRLLRNTPPGESITTNFRTYRQYRIP